MKIAITKSNLRPVWGNHTSNYLTNELVNLIKIKITLTHSLKTPIRQLKNLNYFNKTANFKIKQSTIKYNNSTHTFNTKHEL